MKSTPYATMSVTSAKIVFQVTDILVGILFGRSSRAYVQARFFALVNEVVEPVGISFDVNFVFVVLPLAGLFLLLVVGWVLKDANRRDGLVRILIDGIGRRILWVVQLRIWQRI